MLKIEPLYYLFYAAKYNSLSKAAEHLHITPSAISTSIKNLENTLNLSLITRTSKGITLTKEGEFVVKESANILFHVNLIEDFAKRHNNRNISLEPQLDYLYFFSEASLYDSFIKIISTKIYQYFHDIDLILCDEPLNSTLNTLDTEKYSIALLLLGDDQISSINDNPCYKNINLIKLKSFPTGILYYKYTSHLTAEQIQQDTISLDLLSTLPIIRSNWNTSFQHTCDHLLLSSDSGQFSYKTLAPNITSLKNFLLNDVGVALGIPLSMLNDPLSNFISFKPLEDHSTTSLCFLFNQDLPTPVYDFIYNIVLKVCSLTYQS